MTIAVLLDLNTWPRQVTKSTDLCFKKCVIFMYLSYLSILNSEMFQKCHISISAYINRCSRAVTDLIAYFIGTKD